MVNSVAATADVVLLKREFGSLKSGISLASNDNDSDGYHDLLSGPLQTNNKCGALSLEWRYGNNQSRNYHSLRLFLRGSIDFLVSMFLQIAMTTVFQDLSFLLQI